MEEIFSTRSENRRIKIGPNPTDGECSQRDIRGGSHKIHYVDLSLMTKWIIDDQDDERPPTLRYILKQLRSKGEGSTYYKSMLQAWMKRIPSFCRLCRALFFFYGRVLLDKIRRTALRRFFRCIPPPSFGGGRKANYYGSQNAKKVGEKQAEPLIDLDT